MLSLRDDLVLLVDVTSISSLIPKMRVQYLYGVFFPSAGPVPWWPMVWNKISSPRISFCLWLPCLDRLPVKVRLFSWGLIDDDVCPLCKIVPETRDHLFGQCAVIVPIFSRILRVIGINHSAGYGFNFYMQLFASSTRQKSSLFTHKAAVFCALVDRIWGLRNAVVFRDEQVQVDVVCKQISSMLLAQFQLLPGVQNRYTRHIIGKLQQV